MQSVVRLLCLLTGVSLSAGLAVCDDSTSASEETGAVVRKIQLQHADAREIAYIFAADNGSQQDSPMLVRAARADAHFRPLAPKQGAVGSLPNPQTFAQFFPAESRGHVKSSPLLPQGIVGSPVAYPRDNSVIVKGTVQALDEFEKLLRALDVPTKQVMIRATIINALDRNVDEWGIAWIADAGGPIVTASGNAPAHRPTLRYGKGNFRATLSAGQTHERSRVVSEPFVVTANMHPVDLSVATMYPYFSPIVEYTPWGARVVDYQVRTVAVGVDLFVLPRINPNDTVHLSIAPVFSEIVGERLAPDGQVLPVIAANRFATTVTVRDGETVCIAGLPRERTSDITVGTAYLPPLGQQRERESGEMLIFVTPQIVRGPAATE